MNNSHYFEKSIFFWTYWELWLHKYLWYRMNILLGWMQAEIKVYRQFTLSQKYVPDFLKMYMEKSVHKRPCSSNFSEWLCVEVPGVQLVPALLPLCYSVGNVCDLLHGRLCCCHHKVTREPHPKNLTGKLNRSRIKVERDWRSKTFLF